MGLFGSIGKIAGGLVGGYFGGPAGAAAGSAVGGSLGGMIDGNPEKKANKKAEQAQLEAIRLGIEQQDKALAQQQRQFDISRQDQMPWLEAGQGALAQLVKQLPSLTAAPDARQFREDPGYQFAVDEGQRAIDRSAAARGTLNSGGTLKALARYGQGMADQQYGNWWDRQRAVQADHFNRLSTIAGTGQTTATSLGTQGQNFAGQQTGTLSNIANLHLQGGNARASSYLRRGALSANQSNQNGDMINNVMSIFGSMYGGSYGA